MTTRHCANPSCGKVLVKKHTEGMWHFQRRMTCNRQCGRAWRLASEPVTECIICGGEARHNRRTCAKRACRTEAKLLKEAAVQAEQQPDTWTSATGRTYELPRNPTVRAEFLRVMKKREKEALQVHEAIQRVRDSAPTRMEALLILTERAA